MKRSSNSWKLFVRKCEFCLWPGFIKSRCAAAIRDLEQAISDLREAQAENAGAYEQAMSALEAKHTAMMRQLRTLQSLDTSASAEERAAHALHAVSSAPGGTSSIDDITAPIQSRADVAHARLQQEMGAITPQPDAVADILAQSAMQQRLAARKARPGLPPAGSTTVTELPQQ